MEAKGISIAEKVSASRKLGKAEATDLAKAASRVIVVKGKKLDEFKPKGKPDAALIAAMLGSTGNLRAPLLRVGKTLLVGFNPEAYESVLGG